MPYLVSNYRERVGVDIFYYLTAMPLCLAIIFDIALCYVSDCLKLKTFRAARARDLWQLPSAIRYKLAEFRFP